MPPLSQIPRRRDCGLAVSRERRSFLAWTLVVCAIGILAIAQSLRAEDAIFKGYTFKSPEVVEKVVKGITFKVPIDWPIVERNGEVAPIPIEEYVAGKLGGLEARLRALERRFNGMDLRLRILEQGGVRPSSSGVGLRSTGR